MAHAHRGQGLSWNDINECAPTTHSVDRSTRSLASFSHVHDPSLKSRIALGAALALRAALAPATSGCGMPTVADTVQLGDHADTPEIALDEDFFHCVIQPEVITAFSCAGGASGESGSCHAAKSALRLVEVPAPARCQNGRVIGEAPAESLVNLDRVRTTIGPDAEASPLYQRPLGLASHPRVIFDANSKAAAALRMWLNGGAP